jgi:uncharacterized membrane protein YeaQ/YmgE (transglycosylase-associated protein family)
MLKNQSNHMELDMDIAGLLVKLVGGAVGGNISGAALKEQSLGAIGNTIAGAVGGVAGGYILQAVGVLSSMGLSEMSVGSMATEGGVTAVSGAVLTAIIGFIKSKMGK